MQITMNSVKIKDLCDGYYNDKETDSVVGWGGKLNIRPPYQRAFVYDPKEQEAVIISILSGYPLNVMYWVELEKNKFEVLDGQQRTLSICRFVNGEYAITFNNKLMTWDNMSDELRNNIKNYELTVYFCNGTNDEKEKWFEIVNIAGKKLTNQELKNAVYTGSWLTDAKKYFSKNLGPYYNYGGNYINGEADRQIVLEKVLKWISNDDIRSYMSLHQKDSNASELWSYFRSVIDWAKRLFPEEDYENHKDDMKKVDWGLLYNEHKDKNLNFNILKAEFNKLALDDDVTSISGIFKYLITGEQSHLSLRPFDKKTKIKKFNEQNGICVHCSGKFNLSEMEADHIKPWSLGGATTFENCQMLCANCNAKKSGKWGSNIKMN